MARRYRSKSTVVGSDYKGFDVLRVEQRPAPKVFITEKGNGSN